MHTLDDIVSSINALPMEDVFKKSILDKKEIKELPNIIRDDETLKDVVRGYYNSGNGILVSTDKRLIFIDKGVMWGLKVEDFPFDKISSIQYETGLMSGEIIIFASGNKAKIELVANDRCKAFCENVRSLISNPQEKSQDSGPSNSGDMLEQLERLAKLKESGALSEEEFALAKKKLLS